MPENRRSFSRKRQRHAPGGESWRNSRERPQETDPKAPPREEKQAPNRPQTTPRTPPATTGRKTPLFGRENTPEPGLSSRLLPPWQETWCRRAVWTWHFRSFSPELHAPFDRRDVPRSPSSQIESYSTRHETKNGFQESAGQRDAFSPVLLRGEGSLLPKKVLLFRARGGRFLRRADREGREGRLALPAGHPLGFVGRELLPRSCDVRRGRRENFSFLPRGVLEGPSVGAPQGPDQVVPPPGSGS